MSRNEIILAVAAVLLVGFSLVVALVVPRRRPDFPGDRLGLFTLVGVLLVAGMLVTVEVYGGEEKEATAAQGSSGETSTGPAPSTGTESGSTGETGGGGDVARGKEVFAANCGTCHTLAAAGTNGTVGPNLDQLKPSMDRVVKQVTNGGTIMPAFKDKLSDADIQAVAAYVVSSTQR
jgi:mono/diheme cytochrome c family protein